MFQSDVLEAANVLAGEEWSNGDRSHIGSTALSTPEDDCNQPSGDEHAKDSELSFYHIQIYYHCSWGPSADFIFTWQCSQIAYVFRNYPLVINKWI